MIIQGDAISRPERLSEICAEVPPLGGNMGRSADRAEFRTAVYGSLYSRN